MSPSFQLTSRKCAKHLNTVAWILGSRNGKTHFSKRNLCIHFLKSWTTNVGKKNGQFKKLQTEMRANVNCKSSFTSHFCLILKLQHICHLYYRKTNFLITELRSFSVHLRKHVFVTPHWLSNSLKSKQIPLIPILPVLHVICLGFSDVFGINKELGQFTRYFPPEKFPNRDGS